MPDDVYTTYSFYNVEEDEHDDLKDFKKDIEEIIDRYSENAGGDDIAEYFDSGVDEGQRCYIEYIEDVDKRLDIHMWDAWYPHFEIWDGVFNKYENLGYEIYSIDADNPQYGVNTSDQFFKTRYVVVTEDDNEYFDDLESAREYAADYDEYKIYEMWDEVELFQDEMETVEEV